MDRPLHSYAYVEAPFDLVSRLLAEHAAHVLQEATDEAAAEARQLSRRLRVAAGGFSVSHDVVIEFGAFEPRGITHSVVPLRWRAESGRLLFPQLSADLEVASVVLDPPLTQLTLDGVYTPPLGLLGAGADRLVLHRLAEATVHRFVRDVATRIEDLVRAVPDDQRF